MPFIDYSSAFNTIVPSKLISKLRTLGLNTSLCNWILTGCPQVVRLGNNISATLILNKGAPQGCVLSPLLTAWPGTTPTPSSSLLMTTVVGLITDNDETAYREEVRDLAVWCQDNYLYHILNLNVIKTNDMILDYRKRRTEHAPFSSMGL